MDTAPKSSDDPDTDIRQKWLARDIQKRLGLVLISFFLILIAILAILNITTVYEPPYLLLVLNTVFIGIISIVIASITSRVFTKSGSASVFLIGSGLLILGLGSIVAGWLLPLTGSPNINVTIYNTCACVGSVFILAGAVTSRFGPMLWRTGGRAWIVAAAYLGILVFVALFSLAAVWGLFPPFFIPGAGPTVLRQVILENTVVFFAVASVLVISTYFRQRSDFFFWYSISLALISIGLIAVLIQPSVGSLIGWAGRSAQYLGFVFALYAVLIARRAATVKGLSIDEVIAAFFADTEQSYKMLVETANDAIVTFDENGRVLLWNPAAEQMFGYTTDEAIGSLFTELAIDDPYTGVIKNACRDPSVPDTDAVCSQSVEIVGKHRDGRLFPVELTISRRRQDRGQTVTGILRDLTERKRFEKALREANEELEAKVQKRTAEIQRTTETLRKTHEELSASYEQLAAAEKKLHENEERLIRAQEIGHTGSWEFNLQTGKIWGSAEGARIYGLPPAVGDFPIDKIEACIPERERVHQALVDLIHEGKEYNLEFAINPADGSPQKVIISIARLEKDAQGNAIRVVGVIQDITEHKRADSQTEAALEALRESEERYRGLVETTSDWIWEVDENGVYTYVSPQVSNVIGYLPAEVLGKSPFDFMPHDEAARVGEIFVMNAASQKPFSFLENTNIHNDGHIVILETSGVPVFHQNGQFGGYRGIDRDITERKAMEHQREAFIKELEQKNAELERFTYTVSHDLKSPLITIKGFAGLLEDDALKGDSLQLKKDIHRIIEAADTMQILLADLLELSQVGKIINTPQKIPFGRIAHEAVELFAGQLAERNVTVEIASDLPYVSVDHTRIREVMINLLENAIKFLGDRPDPLIRIGVDLKGETPVFFVQDNGIGIDPRYLERIFNLFEKLDVSQQGTGIGLTLVRRIIEVHGGKVWAESEGPGKGTTFRFTLPVVPAEPTDDGQS